MLLLHLGAQLQLALSPATLRATLHRLGLRWRRPRLAMPRKTDPEKAAKQWRIVEAVLAAGPEAAVLYADESRVQTLPLVARDVVLGRAAVAHAHARREHRAGHLRGAGDPHRPLDLPGAGPDAHGGFRRLPGAPAGRPTRAQPIILIVDNYSSHTAGAVEDWLAEHPRLQLHFLPTHCSPLNPVERIWLQFKDDLAANRVFGSIRLLLAAVDRFFAAMPPEQALIWAAAEK